MFEWVARQVAETGLLGVFVLMVAENIFPPIPSEIIMAASGFAAARGDISLIGTIIVAVLGTLVGNAFWYEIGRWFGMERIRPLVARYGKWFAFETEDMDRAERTLKRWGPFAPRQQNAALRRAMPVLSRGLITCAGAGSRC